MSLPAALQTRSPRKGETVVHLDYGLCRLGPVRRMELSDGVVETVELRFRGGDTLAVPLTDAVRVWGYGASVPKRKLDRVGSEDWAARQIQRLGELRASLDTILDARHLREARDTGGLDMADAALERAGEGFAHELTSCQTRALGEVVDDLRSTRPANRLIIGDVGCGKTEVAVRAALAAALSGVKVRIVAPTRVLARQHHAEIETRAKALGLATALYSGDATKAEKAAIRDSLADGGPNGPDIVVGTKGALALTHAGRGFALTVLDEEQKFGADAKEVEGNLLRLSATPIPRTLAEAKVGLADVSVIETYPAGRGVTETATLDDEDAAIADELQREFARGGRALVLCARIRDLKRVRARLSALLPDARIDRVHSKRKARRNRTALSGFRNGSVDILLATSMLETGINVPDANLMLVFAPHRFGLGQLHQLRGRVGRGARDARFVLVTPGKNGKGASKKAGKGAKTTKAFRRRLRALEQMDARGDGLRLSAADAVLRGSGQFGDDAQTGHACALGLELYEYLLDIAMREGSTQADMLRAVPRVSGEWEWGFEGEWNHAVEQSRKALRDPDSALNGEAPYARLIAAAARAGADRAAVGPKAVVLDLPDNPVTLAPDMDAVAAHALRVA